MGRRGSSCWNISHNSGTCPPNPRVGGIKLFGVQLQKSWSTEYISSRPSPYLPSASSAPNYSKGYLSDDLIAGAEMKNKGVGWWTEEEHKVFLLGLQKIGKGNWRGISREFVTTRSPCQVASHAQKYFLRLKSLQKRNPGRYRSVFDMGISGKTHVVVVSNVQDENPNRDPKMLQVAISDSEGVQSSEKARNGGSGDDPLEMKLGVVTTSSQRSLTKQNSLVLVVGYKNPNQGLLIFVGVVLNE